MRSAVCAWRMATHLWMTRMPARLNVAMNSPGLLPAVSTMGMRSSMMTWQYAL